MDILMETATDRGREIYQSHLRPNVHLVSFVAGSLYPELGNVTPAEEPWTFMTSCFTIFK